MYVTDEVRQNDLYPCFFFSRLKTFEKLSKEVYTYRDRTARLDQSKSGRYQWRLLSKDMPRYRFLIFEF